MSPSQISHNYKSESLNLASKQLRNRLSYMQTWHIQRISMTYRLLTTARIFQENLFHDWKISLQKIPRLENLKTENLKFENFRTENFMKLIFLEWKIS